MFFDRIYCPELVNIELKLIGKIVSRKMLEQTTIANFPAEALLGD
jgi:hypothetical protein